jgi:ferredoxin
VKLQINEKCVGHGRCYTLAPQFLDSDDEGLAVIRGGDPVEVPEGLEQLADEVAGTCPESAITLIQE